MIKPAKLIIPTVKKNQLALNYNVKKRKKETKTVKNVFSDDFVHF